MSEPREMKLGFSLAANGTHKAGWRHPRAQADVAVDFSTWVAMAQAAERGKFHFIFLADGQAVRNEAATEEELSYHGRIEQFEPLTLIAGLSGLTRNLGFVATASTTYNEPYTIARKFASLDHISGGRVGWNVVTSWSAVEAKNFSREKHLEHSVRYRRAEEFVDVVRGLWDSWDDDAFVRDKATGRYFDPEKLHILHHEGEHFSVRGPLNVTRPPQGHPVIAQAGASGPGLDLGARIADLVYTGQKDLSSALRFYKTVKDRLPAFGRSPQSALVMPGVLAIVGRTEQEARDKRDELNDLLHPIVGLEMIRDLFGDLSGHPLDGPPPDVVDATNAVKSHVDAWRERLKREPMSIRQIYENISMTAGHRFVMGTPASVADQLEEWFRAGACDGFNIMVPFMPDPLYEFIDMVVPELQRRGLFRAEYEGRTLRENLGLARPASGAQSKGAAAAAQ